MIQDVHDALCFALWHHQGGSSTIGQPIRKMLDLGPHDRMDKDEIAGAKRVQSALEAQRKPLTPREIELIDGMIEVQLDHAARCDNIANRVMAEKQKGWDMERVELLRKLKEAP